VSGIDSKIQFPPQLFDVHLYDARKIIEKIEEFTKAKNFIDVTITSPPYHDIISYGKINNQIGYGQNYDTYLEDLGVVYKSVYELTKNTGSLWIVVDTFTKNKEFNLLPLKLAEEVVKQGWILKEIIIWKKDKTRPWIKKGQMRKIYEYILFFVKTENFKFYDKNIREIDINKFKEWWVKYPERYNPMGKLPTNIWEYPIPVQGYWSKNNIKHFNPLPKDLIERIILLTTDIDDIVFDPFVGSGMVLAVANSLKRKYIGFELNPVYIENFRNNLKDFLKIKSSDMQNDFIKLQNELSQKIINLRNIKYGKTLIKMMLKYSLLNLNNIRDINSIVILNSKDPSLFLIANTKKTLLASLNVYLVFNNEPPIIEEKKIYDIINKKELTRYQLNTIVKLISIKKFNENFKNELYHKNLWLYANNVTYKYKKQINYDEWYKESQNSSWLNNFHKLIPPILSDIMINETINKTWQSSNYKNNIQRQKLIDILKR
jgi:DNA modification methylase